MLKGKTALITGASRGIGRAIAIEFAKNHADVIVNYYNDLEEAQGVVDSLKKYGVDSIAVKADVSKFEEVKQKPNEKESMQEPPSSEKAPAMDHSQHGGHKS